MRDERTISLGDLTTGSLCRIGITLSSCFWLPAALLMGVAAATGHLPVDGIGDASGPLARFVVGGLQGIAASIATDIVIACGAVIFAATRRLRTAPTLRLRSRMDDRS